MRHHLPIFLLLIIIVSCKTPKQTTQNDLETVLKSGNIENIKSLLNQKLQAFSSYYDASKIEMGYEPMYEALKVELLKATCVKKVEFIKGIAKSLPPKKSFMLHCIINNKSIKYLGFILLAEIPRLISLSQQETSK